MSKLFLCARVILLSAVSLLQPSGILQTVPALRKFVSSSKPSRLHNYNLETNFFLNIKTLRGHGVPGPSIAKLATLYPRASTQRAEQFKTTVESIKKMAFNPSSVLFVLGVNAMCGLNPSTWERKVAVYRSLGWSEGEIISAFTKHPFCMLVSDKKIRQAMDFYMKKLHWGPSFVSAQPKLLCYSLQKRVAPRFLVLSVLASKGLVRRDSAVNFLLISEKEFSNKYVIKYEDQVREMLEAYKGRNLLSFQMYKVTETGGSSFSSSYFNGICSVSDDQTG